MQRSTTERSTSAAGRKESYPDLLAGALAVLAAGPATRTALTFLELFPGAADATLPGGRLFSVFDPADEFVARQRCDVIPRGQRSGVGQQRRAQVRGQLVHYAAGHPVTAHGARLIAALVKGGAINLGVVAGGEHERVWDFAIAPPRIAPGVASMVGYRALDNPGELHRGMPSSTLTFIVSLDDGVEAAESAETLLAARPNPLLLGGLHVQAAHIRQRTGQTGVQLAVHPLAARALFGAPSAELKRGSVGRHSSVGAQRNSTT